MCGFCTTHSARPQRRNPAVGRSTTSAKLGFLMAVSIAVILQLSTPVTAGNISYDTTLSRLPCVLTTRFALTNGEKFITQSTCFLVDLRCRDSLITRVVLSNLHPFRLQDSVGRTTATTDSGNVRINATDKTSGRDTVSLISVRVLNYDSLMDVAILTTLSGTPPSLSSTWTLAVVDLSKEYRHPVPWERARYVGFPLLLGIDASLRHDSPLLLTGFVAQSVEGSSKFILQAPVFSGASGSPVFSQEDGEFLGIVFGKVPNQESLLYAVKASKLVPWIKNLILDKNLRRSCGDK